MHFCVINSKTLMFAGCMVLVMILLGISIGGSTTAQVFFGYSTRQVPVYQVETDEKKVAISFDAAWGADKTQGILDILKEYNCTATFFLVAFWAEKYPEMVKAIDDAGMEIGNHSATHPDLTTVSAPKLADELAVTNQQITSITQKPVRVFRCPYGAYNNDVLNAATAAGMLTVQWSVDSLDWKGISAQEITTRILDRVENGSIILCHNNSDNILDALVMTLDRLLMQGYKVVSVGELVFFEDYSIDRNGIQHKN